MVSKCSQISQASAAKKKKKKSDFYFHRAEFNLRFNKSQIPTQGHFLLSLCQTVIPIFPPGRPSLCVQFVQKQLLSPMQPKICTKRLHTLTWLNDVWSGATPNLSHPSICSASPRCTNSITHGLPSPELCFENRSFILTVNSGAYRYSPTIRSVTKPLCGYLRSTHVTAASVSLRWGVANHRRHTHEECRVTHVGRRQLRDVQVWEQMLSSFFYSKWWKMYSDAHNRV